MNIKPFAVEEWMNEYEVGALYNIAETCVDSVSLDELFELTGENKEDFLKDFCAQRLTYGDIWGSKALRSGIYRTLGQLAQAAGLEDAQARAGLYAFCQLGLIDYTPSPLRYAIRPAVKCSLGDSPMLAALRALGADNTTMERDDAVE